jgi:hypothetical protein
VTAIHAARVAAALRKDGLDVRTESAPYGQFTVDVDGEQVVDGGPLTFLGVLPSTKTIRRRVLEKVRR